MDNVLVLKAAHHMQHRVHLPDVAEKLIAQPLALRRAFDQPGDIDELHLRRYGLARFSKRGEDVQPFVRHRHHADIRLNGAERIIFRRDGRCGQGIEDG